MAPPLPVVIAVMALGLLVQDTTAQGHPSVLNCTVHNFTQNIDHFNWGPALGQYTFQQRYFTYDKYWDGKGPIFFYFGNEDNVELYVNNTGLMWETAPSMKALLVFAEHRYYGESLPFPDGTSGCMNWLTSEQAMADYAVLLDYLKSSLNAQSNAVVGFGGSYGGMLASWFRLKYPDLVDGVVAGSAPIWSFLGMTPPYDDNSYMEIVTYDATPDGGAGANCAANYKRAQPLMATLSTTKDGLSTLSNIFKTCAPLTSSDDVYGLIEWTQTAWSYMAMGNYPYPSGYIIHGNGLLPAFPVRVACSLMNGDSYSDTELLEALSDAMGVYYNYTSAEPCYYNGGSFASRHPARMSPVRSGLRGTAKQQDRSTSCYGDWDYQWCTEITQPFTQGVGKDMFWPPSPFNLTESISSCVATWGVTPRPYWAGINLASKDLKSTSNIVFSNGELDPWRGGGVVANISDTVLAIVIKDGAHHLDLMFSNPADPPSVLQARALERKEIARWVEEAAQKTTKTRN